MINQTIMFAGDVWRKSLASILCIIAANYSISVFLNKHEKLCGILAISL